MVFNRFWRADPARARTTGGTGLGLAIALEDARLHGGWLQAWGTPGGGAQFRLTLPRRAGDALTHSPLPLVPTRRPRGASGELRRIAVALARCSPLLIGWRWSLGGLHHAARESAPVHRRQPTSPTRTRTRRTSTRPARQGLQPLGRSSRTS